jgi:hypothetical protein
MLLRGIGEKLPPDTEVLIAPPKLPYQVLEKMALERSDSRWTAWCVMDLGRGVIDTCHEESVVVSLCLHLRGPQKRARKHTYESAGNPSGADEESLQPLVAGQTYSLTWRLPETRIKLQIQHRELVLVRKRLGEDARYANLRVLVEVLQAAAPASTGTHGAK